ncbi:MAG: prepilin-type N-terminal cleavage/methylation domain-containing protein [Clostridiales bacterium]|nr:prepilin-type N-terminal cleavage/methylation domain-containing protein [Clostridiales bacterium]
MKKMNKKGFTIVELSIVIAVIAILAAILVPSFSGLIGQSKDTAAKENAKIAYQEYILEAGEEEIADNLIYEDNGRFVVIQGNSVKGVYSTKLAAAQAIDADYDATKLDTAGNLTEVGDNLYSVKAVD